MSIQKITEFHGNKMLHSMFKFLVVLRLSLLKNHRDAWYCNELDASKRPKSLPIMCFSDGTN